MMPIMKDSVARGVAGLSVVVLLAGCASQSKPTSSSSSDTVFLSLDLAEVNAPRPASEATDAVRRDIDWLASDERQGRGVGTRGIDEAADYLVARFERLGLRPLPGQDDYFQLFEVSAPARLNPATRLSTSRELTLEQDFVPMSLSASQTFSGQLAFAGYAIKADRYEYNDFADIDVKDRVVLALRYEPHNEQGQSRFTNGDRSEFASLVAKAQAAYQAGAVALLVVNPPQHSDDPDRLQRFARSGPASPIPVIQITPMVADQLLAERGAPTLAALQSSIDDSGKPASRLLDGPTVSGEVRVDRAQAPVKNVIGYLPGIGPNRDEYIVVGAHYDHIGFGEVGSRVGAIGQLHNGADDNASGTTTMMQLAEDIVLSGSRNRSVIFMGYSAEEIGLIGSRHFVDNPLVPLEQIVAMVNLDMVGRLRDNTLYVGGSGTAEPFEALIAAADAASPVELKSMGKGGVGPSDHASFARARIPVLFLFTGLHAEYHAPTDDPPTINVEGIAQVREVAFDLIQGIDRMPRSAYNDAHDNDGLNLPGAQSSRTGLRPQLGVEPDYGSEESTDGMKVAGVIAGTTADDAGMKAGDVLVKLNQTSIKNLYDLTGFLREAKVGEPLTIVVRRDGQDVTLNAVLKARRSAN
jgi:hypothetical protein